MRRILETLRETITLLDAIDQECKSLHPVEHIRALGKHGQDLWDANSAFAKRQDSLLAEIHQAHKAFDVFEVPQSESLAVRAKTLFDLCQDEHKIVEQRTNDRVVEILAAAAETSTQLEKALALLRRPQHQNDDEIIQFLGVDMPA